jgi:hypothetical protein
LHAVLSSSHAEDPRSANWLYNYFARKFFGVKNTQDLPEFAAELRKEGRFADACIQTRSSTWSFWCEDFEQLMHGVWMILLQMPRLNTCTPPAIDPVSTQALRALRP